MKFRAAVEVAIEGSSAAAATVKRDADGMAEALGRVERTAAAAGERARDAGGKFAKTGADARGAAQATDQLETESGQAAAKLNAAGAAASNAAAGIRQEEQAAKAAASATDKLEAEVQEAAAKLNAAGSAAKSFAERVREAARAQREIAGTLSALAEETSQLARLAEAHRRDAAAVREANIVNEARNRILRAGIQFGSENAAAIEEQTRAQQGYRDEIEKSEGSTDDLIEKLGALALAYLTVTKAMEIIKSAVDAALALDSMNRGFTAVTGSAAGAAREMEFVRGLANRLGLDLRGTANDWLKLAAASKGTALEGRGARDIFTAVSEAARVLGLDAQRTSLSLTAIQQMISKGSVSAEELKSQLGENLPGAFQLAAKAMGVTTAELGKMLETGQVTAEVLLPRMARELHNLYGAAATAAGQGPAAQFARMQSAIFDAEGALGKALLPALGDLAQAITNLVTSNGFGTFAKAVGGAVGLIVSALALVVNNLDSMMILMAGFAAANIPAIAAAVANGFNLIRNAVIGVNAAMAANPAVAAWLLVAAAVAAVNYAIKQVGAEHAAETARMVAGAERVREAWGKTQEAMESANASMIASRRYLVESQLSVAQARLDELKAEADRLLAAANARPDDFDPNAQKGIGGAHAVAADAARKRQAELKEAIRLLGEQKGAVMALEEQMAGLSKAQTDLANGEGAYGAKVQSTLKALQDKINGLVASREQLGLVGLPFISLKAKVEAAGNAMEKISKLGIDPTGKGAEKIKGLELTVAALSEELQKAQSTTLPDKIDKLADAASLAQQQLRAVGDAYAISTAAGLAAQRQMEAEIAVRGRLRGATEEQIQAQIKEALAQGEEQRRTDTQKTLTQMAEEMKLRDQVTEAYKRGVEVGDQVAQQIEQQININNSAATSAADLEEAIRRAYAEMAKQQQAIKAARMKAEWELEEKQLKELIATYGKGAAAVARLTVEQARIAEKLKLVKGLTDEQKDAVNDLIDRLLVLRDTNRVDAEIAASREELDLLVAKANVRRQDFATVEQYRAKLAEVTFEYELQKKIIEAIAHGASPAQLAAINDIARAAHDLNKVLENDGIRTAWQQSVNLFSSTLQDGMLSAGTEAINGWKGLGDSFVEKLLSDLIKAFASAALKAAITAAFSNNGGGFWGNLVSAFSGSTGGGGGSGGGGAGGWISTLAGAYRAWKGGASLWGGLTGTTTTTGTGGLSATAATTQVSNGYTITTGAGAGSGGGSAGLGAGATALAVAAVGAAIIYAFKLYLDKREAKQFDDTGQKFYMGYGINPADPVNHLPPVDPGSPHDGAITQGGQNKGFDFLFGDSSSGPIGRLNVPEIQTRGSLGNMIGAEQVEALRKLVSENTLGLVDSLGGLVKGLGEFTLNIRNDGKEFMTTIDGVEKTFKTIDEAISAGIANMLDAGQFEGLSANIEAVLHNANEIGLEGLQGALDLAKQADAALSGSLSATAPAVTLFQSQMKELEKQIQADTEQGLKWGISLESLNALGEKRIEQLKREQEAFAGQQVATTLEQLFALSPQAAADAELAMIYQRAVGAMRIAQLQMEADKLAALGYLTAAQMNKIQEYIQALDVAGAGAAAISGGGGGGGEDPGVAQREARRAELWQMMRDLEAGGAAAIGSLQAALDKARGLGQEMRDLNMGDIYADKMTKLATLAAGAEFVKPFQAILTAAGKTDAQSKWDELQKRYADYQAALLAGAAELTAAGFDVEEAMRTLRAANQVEAAKMAQDLAATFGDPFLKLGADARDLANRLALLDQMVVAGAIAAGTAAQIHRWVAEQAFAGLADSLLGIIDRYYGQVAEFDAVRIQMAQMKFDLEIAQLQLQFELIKSMGFLTEAQIANIDAMFAYIAAHPPDFSQQPGTTPTNGPDPGTIGSGIDQAAQNLERLMQMLRGWEDLALSPAERRLRDINEQYAQMLELAGRDQALIARVRAAYGLALKDFYDGLRAPLKDLLRDLGLGGSSTATTRNQVLDLKAQYDALVQRLAANPNDAAALEQLNTVARALLQAASGYGQDGALYAGIAASMQAMLPRILAGTPFDPRFAAGSGANDNGSTDRRGRLQNPGTTRDPLLEQGKRDREAQARENGLILSTLIRIEAKIGKDSSAANDFADIAKEFTAQMRRKLR